MSQPDEVRAQRIDAPLHEDKVHVGVGPVVGLVDETRFRCRSEFTAQSVDGKLRHDERARRRWHLSHGSVHAVGSNELPHFRCRHHLTVILHAVDASDGYPTLWQPLHHCLIIPACELIEGLTAHKAHRGSEGRSNIAAEYLQVEFYLLLCDDIDFLEEISGEGGFRYRISTALTNRHVHQILRCTANHLSTLLVVESHTAVEERDDIEVVDLPRGVFH